MEMWILQVWRCGFYRYGDVDFTGYLTLVSSRYRALETTLQINAALTRWTSEARHSARIRSAEFFPRSFRISMTDGRSAVGAARVHTRGQT